MEKKALMLLAAKGGFLVALLSGLAALAAGLGTRCEVWDYRTGLKMLRWASYGGLTAAVLSLPGMASAFRSKTLHTLVLSLSALILGVALVAVPLYWLHRARTLPAIHDISTDTENPPKFVALRALRKSGINPLDYGGPQVALGQHDAYPDIAPLTLAVLPDIAYEKAYAVARGMGWEIVDAQRAEGRIEATDTTFWFGFKDDIVIRITHSGSGSRVDVRSVSRVGVSDVGKNAERIREFLREMKAR